MTIKCQIGVPELSTARLYLIKHMAYIAFQFWPDDIESSNQGNWIFIWLFFSLLLLKFTRKTYGKSYIIISHFTLRSVNLYDLQMSN